jgi:hypothetical protein
LFHNLSAAVPAGFNRNARRALIQAKETAMPYELRVPGAPPQRFETEQDAVEAAKQLLQGDLDAEPEIIDLATGKPAAPGASRNWREELKNRVGF